MNAEIWLKSPERTQADASLQEGLLAESELMISFCEVLIG